MREIKFRAWDGKRMTTTMIQFDNSSGEIKAFGRGVDGAPNQNFPIMQYTGLKDKNGKEIYEGDLIKVLGVFSGKYEVVFDQGYFGFNDELFEALWDWITHVEVIGNIYENPDLHK